MKANLWMYAIKVGVVVTVFGAASMLGQDEKAAVSAASSGQPQTVTASAPVAGAAMGYVQPQCVGSYYPDGRFHRPPRRVLRLAGAHDPVGIVLDLRRPAEVPAWVDLHPVEAMVKEYAPPAHPTEVVRPRTAFASLLDDILTFAYGHETILRPSTHITTDSRKRLILSDEEQRAVHVLDGKNSFRIAGGAPGLRLQEPRGVAVDGDDNIYVVDNKRGLILVYGPQGHFVRSLGELRGESIFENPTGIAIDRKAGHVYVVDSTANQMTVLDLAGEILMRLGSRRNQGNGVSFDRPTRVAVGTAGVAVLDSDGSRVQILDAEGKLVRAFTIRIAKCPMREDPGLALDSAGNIYVSNLDSFSLRVYREDGQLIGSVKPFGRPEHEEFAAPSGVWIDASDRIYVADTPSSYIQVFQAGPRQLQAGSHQ